MEFDTWESYFYADTVDPLTGIGTLRNLFDERDVPTLDRLEYAETMRRQRQLMAGEVEVPRTYDAEHVRAIHRHLFQDVYPWAGEYRTINMAKGPGRSFGDVRTGELGDYLRDVH
jgi:cell filamentation protein